MEQITIITKDYHGLTADITSALGSNDINIESLDAKKIDDIGLVMLRVNQYDRALSILRVPVGTPLPRTHCWSALRTSPAQSPTWPSASRTPICT